MPDTPDGRLHIRAKGWCECCGIRPHDIEHHPLRLTMHGGVRLWMCEKCREPEYGKRVGPETIWDV
jgi:hypothetical protein